MAKFSINTNVYWGADKYEQLFEYLNQESFKIITFIIDASLSKNPRVTAIIKKFESQGFQIENKKYIRLAGEPSYEFLDSAVHEFKGIDTDLLVAIGGGSLIDLAKGIAILVKNSKAGIHYRGFNRVEKPGVPICVFPSTAGTGSEVTWTASFVDTKNKTKLGINGKYVAPLCGVLEPELLSTCPPWVMVSAGLDAMVHSVEAITARTANLISSTLGERAFGLIYKNLPLSLNKPSNLEYKEKLLIGAYMAGIAMMNAGGGPASGVSYPIGVHFKVPHGIAGGFFLGQVFRQNISKGYNGYLSILKEITGPSDVIDKNDINSTFINLYDSFYDEIGAPKNLSEWGIVNEAQILQIIELTLSQRFENLKLNPVSYDEDDLRYLLQTTLVNN